MSKILVFMGSPRKGGNTDLLAEAFISGAQGAGADTQKFFLNAMKISPCIECGGCNETGECVIKDDMSNIYTLIADSDVIVVASPIFFYNITSATQALVERSQACWMAKYALKKGVLGGKKRKGFFISVGATSGKKLFEGASRVIRYFCDAVDADYQGALLYRGVDAKGAVKQHETALQESEELGRRVASGMDLSNLTIVK